MQTKTGEAGGCRPSWIERVERTVDAVAREHVFDQFRALVDQFTDRERDVFCALLRGSEVASVGDALGLPQHAIDATYLELASKLEVATPGELVRIATWSGY